MRQDLFTVYSYSSSLHSKHNSTRLLFCEDVHINVLFGCIQNKDNIKTTWSNGQ